MTDAASLVIRRCEDADHDAVWDLHNLALNDVRAHAGNGPWDDDLHHIRQEYLDAGGEFIVGLLDGRIVAMGALKRIDDRQGEVKRMRIHPDHQRRGFGRAILHRLMGRARQLGFRKLRLDTTAQQTAARALYQSEGFQQVGGTVFAGFDVLLMERDLQDPHPPAQAAAPPSKKARS